MKVLRMEGVRIEITVNKCIKCVYRDKESTITFIFSYSLLQFTFKCVHVTTTHNKHIRLRGLHIINNHPRVALSHNQLCREWRRRCRAFRPGVFGTFDAGGGVFGGFLVNFFQEVSRIYS